MPSSDQATPSTKQQLRKQIRTTRAALVNRDQLSIAIADHVLALSSYQTATTIHLYIAAGSEVATTKIAEHAFSSGKTVIVPWCTPHDTIEFFRLASLDELAPGSHGLLEPNAAIVGDPSRKVAPRAIPFWLIPGVAFDEFGGRMGQGRGHYDRVLQQLSGIQTSRDSHTPPPYTTLGLAFECQIVDRVPLEPHDIPLSGVVTERGTHWRQQAAS